MGIQQEVVLMCIRSFFCDSDRANIVTSHVLLDCIIDGKVKCAMKVLLADGQDILPGHKKSRVVVQTLDESADQHAQYLFLQESAPYRYDRHGISFSR